MKVTIAPDREALGRAAATQIASLLRERLAGQDPVRVIFAAAPSQSETLAHLVATPDLDWSRIEAFHMDEYLGLPLDHPARFAAWLDRNLFTLVPFRAVHRIQPEPDPNRCVAEYARLLGEAPIDLVVCGIGANGHIAFNDPAVADFADPLAVKIVELDDVCRQQQVDDDCFATLPDVPTHAITVTIPQFMRAATVVCVVPGSLKEAAVTAALTGPVTPMCPASILTTHPHCYFFLDEEAGANVTPST